MKVKYIRVSSILQNESRQVNKSKEFTYFIDKCSGSIPFFEREQGAKIKALIEQGQEMTIYFHSISRFGRNLKDILEVIEYMETKKVQCVFEKEGVNLLNAKDKITSTSRMLISVIGALATQERDLILERQKEGIEIAKMQGKYKGRKVGATSKQSLLEKHGDVVKLIVKKKDLTQREISAIVGKSLGTVYNVSKALKNQ